MNKFLIVGLGNVGAEYEGTRHNAGFMVVDALAEEMGVTFESRRYGYRAEGRVKNKTLVLLKPSTFMNLSGNAVRYRLKEEKVPIENLLVVVDELALPFGTLRFNVRGSHGGHNGLRHIEETLGTQGYPRLRFGIGNNFSRGQQVQYVLEPFSPEEMSEIQEHLQLGAEIVKSFCLAGADITMNSYNKRSKKRTSTPPASVKREETTTDE